MTQYDGITGHLRELDEAAEDWKRYRSISLADLKADRDKRNMVLQEDLPTVNRFRDLVRAMLRDRLVQE